MVLPNHPLVGGAPCFSMGRVRSGWLSKFWCIPVLFQWVFGLLNSLDITRSHLLDTQQLDSAVGELRSKCSQRSPGPSTLGSYNVHNVLAGSKIFDLGLFCQASSFPKPKTQVIWVGKVILLCHEHFPKY